MHCEKFEARLMDLLDARQRPESDAALLTHAESCENCRELLAAQEQLFTGLELWEPPAMSADFTARTVALALQSSLTDEQEEPVVAMLVPLKQASSGHSRSDKRVWWVLSAGMAAALLLAIYPVSQWLNSGVAKVPTEDAQPVAEGPETPVPTPPSVEIVQSPKSENVSPMGMTPEQLAAEGEEFIRTIQETPVDQSVERIPGFRPIVSTFGLAIGAARKTLPGPKESTSGNMADPKQPILPNKPQAETRRDLASDWLV